MVFRMYNEKINSILEDIENKELELAGGSVVGVVLSTTNALIKYICNLSLGKKKYENEQEEIQKIKLEAEILKKQTLLVIDQDKEILEEILVSYKTKKENPSKYEKICKEAVEFCMKVTQKALDTLKLADKISKIGNKMLASDFKICKNYAFASVEASIENVKINLISVENEEYKKQIENKYREIYDEAIKIKAN